MSAESAFEQNRNSSKAWLFLIMVLMLAYGALNILKLMKRKAGQENYVPVIHAYVEAFLQVMERDMMPVILIYGMCIILGGFYIFAALLGYLLLAPIGILTFAYASKPKNDKLILIGKGVNIGLVSLIFLNIWFDDLKFE